MEDKILEVLIELSNGKISLEIAHERIIKISSIKTCMSCEEQVEYSSGTFSCEKCSY